MDVHLSCKDQRQPRDGWILTLRDDGCLLTDPNGIPWARFPKDQAENRIRLPSFAESITDIRVYADNQQWVIFYQTPQLVEQIRSFYHRQLAAQGPAAIEADRRKGWGFFIGGTMIWVLCLGLTLTGMVLAYTSPNGGSYYVLTGGFLLGIVLAAKGLRMVKSARRAEDELRSQAGFPG